MSYDFDKYVSSAEYSQADIVEFIEEFWATNHYAPSFREIAEGVGFASTSSVSRHLGELRDAGRVEYTDNTARSVRVI